MNFQIFVADPPWNFLDKLKQSDVKRGASSHYNIMTMVDIKNLPVKDLIHPEGSILALWVPSALLQDGLDIMKAWGFNFKQTYIWIKQKKDPVKQMRIKKKKNSNIEEILSTTSKLIDSFNLNNTLGFGMGRAFRNCHEICLIGTSNNKIYKKLKNRSQRTVSFAPNLKHSAKPENLQDSLDIMFPEAKGKIELFARRQRTGWTCLGNEIGDMLDIRDSLSKL